jgi:hypothetical protein
VRSLWLLVALTLSTACATSPEDAPDATELDSLDQWATVADGKADLPTSWNDLVAWLEDFYMNQMSAIWHNQEHPRTAQAAIDRAKALARAAGIDNPTSYRFRARVQRLRTEYIDHSEVDIVLGPGKVLRLVGDPKGAGAFVDTELFEQSIGSPLCLTWAEVETAIRASYVPGAYAVDFVCHTITEQVMRSLGAGTRSYSSQVRTYAAARWIWGPLLPSLNSQDPANWSVSRACPI